MVFNSETCSLLPTTDIKEQIEINYLNIEQQITDYVNQGSGWVLLRLDSINLNIIRYDPLKASSYIDLPINIKNKKACINIQNNDQKCFLWSLLAHLYPVNHTNNQHYVSHYQKFEHELNMEGIEYPVPLKKIPKFEALNNISVNVFGIDNQRLIIPVRITEEKKEKHVNLLFLSNSKNNHYVLIKDMSRLLAGQLNHHDPKTFICDYCLHGCTNSKILEKHVERCKEHRAQLTKYPKPGSKLKFSKFEHQLPLPMYFVADLETVQQPIDTVLHDPLKSSTTKIKNHLPCSASYMAVFTDPKYFQSPKVFKGENCIMEFLNALQADITYYKECYGRSIELIMSEEDESKFEMARICHICSKELVYPYLHCHREDETDCNLCKVNAEVDIVVRDHDHVDGLFRNAACNGCNLNYRLKADRLKIPIFFHNLKGYDAHLILSYVDPKKHGRVTCIPKTTEQYTSFTIGDMVFKDSLAFMGKGLDDLVKTLQPNQLNLTRKYIEDYVSKNKTINLGLYDDISKDAWTEDESCDETAPPSKRRKYDCVNNKLERDDARTVDKSHNKSAPSSKRQKCEFVDSEAEDTDDDGMTDEEDIVTLTDEEFIDDNIYETDHSFYRTHRETVPSPIKKRNLDSTTKFYCISDLPTNDYRHHPHTSPSLTDEQKYEVEEKFRLMKAKGVYPYEYITSLSILEEDQLPLQEKFYSSLEDKHITDEQYKRAEEVWRKFNMKTLWHYHDLYLIMDVLLLADVLNAFRKTCMENYNIDPLHSYTAPGFAWEAALRMTGVELELLFDKDKYIFFEAAKRGGISVISHRYAKANIPGQESYDRNKPTSYLMYLDANNLYGWALMQHLPTGGFKWVIINLEDVLNTADDSRTGYTLEVDICYPSELHDHHNEYPLAAEKILPSKLSHFQQGMLRQQYLADVDQDGKCRWSAEQIEKKIEDRKTLPKLIPNLHGKKGYIVDYRLLKFYISMGLKVTKVHRILQYQQSPWLKPFIDFNTNMRATAKSDFEKDFFKLLNNSVFGKTMQNTRDYRNIDLVGSKEKALKLSSQPTYRSYTIFHDKLIAIERYRTTVKMDKPIYVGVTALDLSKLLMYDFHYNFIKKEYPGEQSRLCFTDTDSFLYELQTNDIYSDILSNNERFDLSEYKDDHQIFERLSKEEIRHLKQKNKKVVGKFKDELKGNLLLEFVGLRAKAYSYRYEKEVFVDENGIEVDEESMFTKLTIDEAKKLKGLKKYVVSNTIHFGQYKQSLLQGINIYVEMKTFRSYGHKLSTISQNKLALSRYDDKRYILEDGISTRAYGHYIIL